LARILIVDDDAMVRQLLRIVLRHLGHEVVEAQNGREGLQQYQAQPADVVITDMQMPEMGGLEMIQEIQRDFPEAMMIAISGGPRSSLDAAKALGVLGTFEKPFSLIALRDTVEALLESPYTSSQSTTWTDDKAWADVSRKIPDGESLLTKPEKPIMSYVPEWARTIEKPALS
jgi:two-component system response regulator (stage 0 sporulation protein F)